MRILKEKLKVRIRASGFNTINEGQLCCFVLFFLLNLFLTAQNIHGFCFLDPDDVGLCLSSMNILVIEYPYTEQD